MEDRAAAKEPAADVPEKSPARILREALDLFSTRGYEATSVREICAAAGITKPTLYHFYGSKEGVYRALVGGAMERHRHEMEAATAGSDPAPVRLQRVARTYFRDVHEQPRLMRFIFGLIHNPASAAPPTDFPGFYAEIVRLVSDVIEDGVRRGELRPGPAPLRILAYMGALGEAVCGQLLTGLPELTPELADGLVDTVIQGWLCSK